MGAYYQFKKDENGVYYLYDYYRKGSMDHVGVSELILDLKNGDPLAVNYFYLKIEEALGALIDGTGERTLMAVSGHLKNTWNPGILMVEERLCNKYGFIDGARYLKRVKDHDKLSQYGDRSIQSHLNSIRKVLFAPLRKKRIILMDDITTTGNSLLACEMICRRAGAKDIIKIAIGKTI